MNSPIATKRKKGSGRVMWDRIAIVIAFFALLVAVFSFFIGNRPLLYIGLGNCASSAPVFGLFVRNNGLGPATIKSIDFRFDGKPVPSTKNLSEYIVHAGFQDVPMDFVILEAPIEKGSVIGEGQEVLIFAGSTNEISDLGHLETLLRRVNAHITYLSVAGLTYDVWFPNKKD